MNTAELGVAWNKDFELGNEEVDAQHKRLFELVNKLMLSCQEGEDSEMLQEALDFLVNYTVLHFQYEEDLQIQVNYPDYARHRLLHEEFKDRVIELVKRYWENGSSEQLNNEVNRIVVRWLINHIIKEDKKIGMHIRSIKESGR